MKSCAPMAGTGWCHSPDVYEPLLPCEFERNGRVQEIGHGRLLRHSIIDKACDWNSPIPVNFFQKPTRRSKQVASALSLGLTALVGLADYYTGHEVRVWAFYLLPACFSAWVAGRTSGLLVAATCSVAWFVSDQLSGFTYQHPIIRIWNELML